MTTTTQTAAATEQDMVFGARVRHTVYGLGTVIAPYSGPFGKSWVVEMDNGTEMVLRLRDVAEVAR